MISPVVAPIQTYRADKSLKIGHHSNRQMQICDSVSFGGISSRLLKYNPVNYYANKLFKRTVTASRERFHPLTSELKKSVKVVTITTADKQKLNCLDFNNNKSKKYVIYLHGMSQNVYHNQELYKAMMDKGYGVLALEYRGFGKNAPAKVTEDLIGYDLDAAVLYLKSKKIKSKNIGVVGHSLGSVLALDAGKRNPDIGFVAAISPIVDFSNVALRYLDKSNNIFPSWVQKLVKNFPSILSSLRHQFNMNEKINKLNVPTYIIHSKNDGLVRLEVVRNMSAKANNLVDYVELPVGGHRMEENKIKAIQDILK